MAIGPGEVPAIHPARSNPPPAIALLVAPEIGEARECCSNSARISGSTKQWSDTTIDPRRGWEKKHVLFFRSLGIPRVMPSATTASKIIGFLTKLKGETVVPQISMVNYLASFQLSLWPDSHLARSS